MNFVESPVKNTIYDKIRILPVLPKAYYREII